ncbi:hypothetical protein [Nocardia sp. NPDC059691]|uniref:hypothetical protein n=1 Tax=Nocardia sp. NPDC059691 TaxID=3346908 RepID=UPI0036C256BF
MSTRAAADIATVAMMMDRLGLTVADLSAQTGSTRAVPTFAEYIPTVLAAMPDGRTRTHYQTYWNKILAQPGWAQRRLDEPTPADLRRLCETIRAQRVIRRSDRGGREVVGHVIDVWRRLYKHAEDNRIIEYRDNPAARLTKPKRTRSNRRALQAICSRRSCMSRPLQAMTRSWIRCCRSCTPRPTSTCARNSPLLVAAGAGLPTPTAATAEAPMPPCAATGSPPAGGPRTSSCPWRTSK